MKVVTLDFRCSTYDGTSTYLTGKQGGFINLRIESTYPRIYRRSSKTFESSKQCEKKGDIVTRRLLLKNTMGIIQIHPNHNSSPPMAAQRIRVANIGRKKNSTRIRPAKQHRLYLFAQLRLFDFSFSIQPDFRSLFHLCHAFLLVKACGPMNLQRVLRTMNWNFLKKKGTIQDLSYTFLIIRIRYTYTFYHVRWYILLFLSIFVVISTINLELSQFSYKRSKNYQVLEFFSVNSYVYIDSCGMQTRRTRAINKNKNLELKAHIIIRVCIRTYTQYTRIHKGGYRMGVGERK